MKVEEIGLFRKLQEHLDKLLVGFPSTKFYVELELLQYLITPKQVRIAIKLSFT